MFNPIQLINNVVFPKTLSVAPLLIAGGMGVLSLMGNNQRQKDADRQASADAESMGIRNAGIDFAAERTAEMLSTRMTGILDQRVAQSIGIDKAQAQAESDAIVNAAAAGVSGQSVDAVVNATERTAGEAKASLDKQVRQEALQLENDYTDTYLNAEISKGNVNYNTASKGERFGNQALSFAQGFLGGF